MSDAISLLDKLAAWMRQQPSVLVAYSGGVDSALLMAVAHRELGDKALACIGFSPSLAEREMNAAVDLAKSLGANVRIIQTQEQFDPNYAANPVDRCYFCKSDLFARLTKIAHDEGWAVVVDGNNADDLGDHRPGRVAAQEKHVRSPLVELGITKQQIRDISKHLGLPVWDKPAMACLASRVPTGTPILPGLLNRIERAEDVLAGLGFRQFRVRHHGEIARVELPAEDLPRALEHRDALVEGIKQAGYRFVTLDLSGFRSGSLNRPTNETPIHHGVHGVDGGKA